MLVSALVSLATGSLALSFLYFVGVCLLLVGLALLPVATYRAAILRIGAPTWWAPSPRSSSEGSGRSWSASPGSLWLTSFGRGGVPQPDVPRALGELPICPPGEVRRTPLFAFGQIKRVKQQSSGPVDQ